MSYIFSSDSCSYISENRNPKKLFISQEMELPYISGKVYSVPLHNGTFLYLGKGIFTTLT